MEPSYIGQIQLFAIGFAPQDFIICDGRTLPVQQYQALYALIQNLYGGDINNFAIPDLRGFEPIPNTHYCIAVEGYFPPRQ